MSYWQIAAGSDAQGRNYIRYFLKYGMAFVGGKGNIAAMGQVRLGDIIVLKKGLYEIHAAGVVVERGRRFSGNEDKEWLNLEGWDLSAYCYVDWHIPPRGFVVFTDGLTIATIARLPQQRHQDIANDLIANAPVLVPDAEPTMPDPVGDEAMLEFLISKGVRPSAANDITDTLRKIRLLAKYYYHNTWGLVREHETRTFLVIPFLLALGWAEQQIKIELPCANGKIDIACFRRIYTTKSTECMLIVETKDFTSGLDFAPEQGQAYAQNFPDCRVVLVTNGYCYKSYVKQADGQFSIQPTAYLNLLDPRTRYPLDPLDVDGAYALLQWLLPSQLL